MKNSAAVVPISSGPVKRKPLSKRIRFEVFKRDSFTCQFCGRTPPEVILEEPEEYPGEDFRPDPPRPGTLAPGQTLEEFCDLYQRFS